MAGTFSVNGYSVSILFDSGASHTFISKEWDTRVFTNRVQIHNNLHNYINYMVYKFYSKNNQVPKEKGPTTT